MLERLDMGTEGNYDTYFKYDILGNLIKSVPPNANGDMNSGYKSTFAYNSLGQMIKKSSPDEDGDGDGISTDEVSTSGTPDYEYQYDLAGNLRFVLDPNGRNAASSGYFTYNKYDEHNRLIESGKKLDWNTNFTDANASNASYPTDGEVLIAYCYDEEPSYGSGIWIDASEPGTMKNLYGKLAAQVYKDLNTGEYGYTFYSYNKSGNVETIIQDIPGTAIGTKTLEYEYDLSDNLTKLSYQSGESDKFYSWYDYDDAGRLEKVFTNTLDNRSTAEENIEYIYDPTGQFKRVVYGETAQGVDYIYNTRDWITQINHQNINSNDDPGHDGLVGGENENVTVDQFGLVMGYDYIGHIGDTQNADTLYNGNISWMMWKNAGLSSPYSMVGYSFDYDNANQLLEANYGYYSSSAWQSTTGGDLTNLDYDKNGNIESLTRYGLTNGLMDQFTYNYDTTDNGNNRLLYVDDAATSSDYETDIDDQSSGNYVYDGNGNIVTDLQKNISSITYDTRNLQHEMNFGLLSLLILNGINIDNTAEYKAKDTLKTESSVTINSGADVTFKSGGTITLNAGFSVDSGAVFSAVIDASLQQDTIGSKVRYVYDAGGNRVRKDYTDFSTEKYYVRDAGGNVISVYDENGDQKYVNLFGSDVIGKYVPSNGYYYYIKDQLGSTRVVVDESGDVMEAYEYFPFGRISRSYLSSIGTDEKFTGKELDNDNEERLYYFGARYYDGDLGKWLSVDPLADKYPGWSPYNYVSNNPLRLVDKDGREGDDYTAAMYANRNNLSAEGQGSFDGAFSTAINVGAAFIGGAVAIAKYGYAMGGFIAANAPRLNKIGNGIINALTPGGTGFNSASGVKGLNVGGLQRLNVAGQVKLGLKTATEASKTLAKGGAAVNGTPVPGSGKLITLSKTSSGKIKVIVKNMVDGKITNTSTTTGSAKTLGIQNADELMKKGTGYDSHWIGEVK